MSEEINPGMQVPETVQPDVAEVKEEKTLVNYAEKTLAELTGLFQELLEDIDRLKKSKEAEAIKSAFYKKLSKEKAEAGVEGAVEEPSADEEVAEAPAAEAAEPVAEPEKVNPFVAIEEGFKSLYLTYKKERAEYNREQEKEREENLSAKQQVIEDLKALVENQEDVSSSFPAFREIQNRWREIGPVPAQNFRNLNDTYQFLVEKFYDMVKINRDLRDLDFKKNLEAKEAFCQEAERLAENENVVDAFRELQKLHEQWKEFGPVAKEFREEIWDRFKAATAVINKKYQAYFEGQKEKFAENLQAKAALCEKVEAFAAQEIASSNEWNAISKQIEDIQKEWRSIGFASKKDNQKIYDRFRAACDAFYGRKRDFYSQYKDSMNENLDKKLAIIEKAEALKESKEWKKTTDLFIELQKEWKEIGAVPRKKSEQLWKRFRAACDSFFDAKAKEGKADNEFYANLKAKRLGYEKCIHSLARRIILQKHVKGILHLGAHLLRREVWIDKIGIVLESRIAPIPAIAGSQFLYLLFWLTEHRLGDIKILYVIYLIPLLARKRQGMHQRLVKERNNAQDLLVVFVLAKCLCIRLQERDIVSPRKFL